CQPLRTSSRDVLSGTSPLMMTSPAAAAAARSLRSGPGQTRRRPPAQPGPPPPGPLAPPPSTDRPDAHPGCAPGRSVDRTLRPIARIHTPGVQSGDRRDGGTAAEDGGAAAGDGGTAAGTGT